jgi:D-3-phosphoglycerate dehydrogenase
LRADALAGALSEINVLVVRGTEVSGDAVRAGNALNLIIRAGAGYSNIDVAAASERGIYVATTPGKNASAVAELAFTLIGCLDRRVPDAVASLRAGKWEKHEYARAIGLAGRRIGILGMGHVGRAVLRLAKAYDLEPHAFSRSLTPSRASELGVARAKSPEELARDVDIFTVHLELVEKTREIVNRRVLEALPDGAIFVNTARPELVDYVALAELAPKKRLRVGLDVLPDEPAARHGARATLTRSCRAASCTRRRTSGPRRTRRRSRSPRSACVFCAAS